MRAVRLLAAIVVAMMVQVSTAQDYPGSKPIRLIVPFPPAGGTDIFGRQIADKLRATSNWTVVVDNKAGASTSRAGSPRTTACCGPSAATPVKTSWATR